MKKSPWKRLVLASVAGIGLASNATADVVYNFTNQTWTGFNFTELNGGTDFVFGTLTAVSVNATLNASTSYTYADDLCIYVSPRPLQAGGLLQVGGFSNLNANQQLSWANGGSSNVGTTVIDTKSVNPISFAGTTSDLGIFVGNGYGAAGTSGTWTGSITLFGLDRSVAPPNPSIPEPGTLALLASGAMGLVARWGWKRRTRG
jgi:PEP-CTERM motif